jgi:hypothetical protein
MPEGSRSRQGGGGGDPLSHDGAWDTRETSDRWWCTLIFSPARSLGHEFDPRVPTSLHEREVDVLSGECDSPVCERDQSTLQFASTYPDQTFEISRSWLATDSCRSRSGGEVGPECARSRDGWGDVVHACNAVIWLTIGQESPSFEAVQHRAGRDTMDRIAPLVCSLPSRER